MILFMGSAFSERFFPMMADVSTGRCGIHQDHVTGLDEPTENRFIGIGSADGPDFGVIAFEQDFQVGFQLILNFIDIGGSPVIPFSGMPFAA